MSGVHSPGRHRRRFSAAVRIELIDIRGHRVRSGVTLPLGSLALQDLSHKSLKRAERIVRNEFTGLAQLTAGRKPDLLCGRRHLAPQLARIQHHPERLSAQGDARAIRSRPPKRSISRRGCDSCAATNMLANIEAVAVARRPLLAYAALVLEHIIRVAKPKTIVFSTFGVREGLLHEMLPPTERTKDGLICAAQELNKLLVAVGAPCRGTDGLDRPAGSGW